MSRVSDQIELRQRNSHNESNFESVMEDHGVNQVSLHLDLRNSSTVMIDLPRIVLALRVPRRAEILRTVGWPFSAG